MNFTIGAILIIVFLLPGYLFRKGFYNFPYSRHLNKSNSFDEISSILICSVVLHLLFYLLLDYYQLLDDLKAFIIFYYDDYEIIKNHSNFIQKNNLRLSFSNVTLMFFGFWIASLHIGLILNKNIREFKLDTKIRFFKYSNDWYYYLSGLVLDYPDEVGDSSEVNLVYIDILTRINDETSILYSGILVEYNLDSNGNLKNISLNGAVRHVFKPNNNKPKIIKFPTSYLIIPADEIININIRYFKDLATDTSREYSEAKLIKIVLQHFYNLITLYYPLYGIYLIFKLLVGKPAGRIIRLYLN